MAYTIGSDGCLDFSSCENDKEKIDQCWEYFRENLADTKVIAYDGKLVRGFTETSFNHIISGSSNKYDIALGHDIDFVECRARCLPLIGKVIRGQIKSRCYRLPHRDGKKTSMRKVLAVVETEHEHFLVVMGEVKERYAILTAYPSNKSYVDRRVRALGTFIGVWEEKQ